MAEPRLRLGEQLLAAGLITEDGLKEALAEQKVEGGFLADRLVELGLVDERALLRFLAEISGAKYITVDTLSKASLPPDALEKIPARHAELLCVLPLAYDPREGTLTLAVPELDAGLTEQVRLAASVTKVQAIVALRAAIRAGIRRFYYSDHYAFATLDHGTAKPVVRAPVQESVVARSSAPKPFPKDPANDLEPLKAELERWKAVAELSRVLAQEKNLKALLHRGLAFAFDRIPADDGVALTWDPKQSALIPRAVRTRSGEASEVIVSETLLKEVLAEGGMITTDAAVDSRFSTSESVIATGLRSAMGIRLKVGEQMTGALIFATRGEKAGQFKDSDLTLAMSMGEEVALAVGRIQDLRREETETAQRDRYAKHFPPVIAEQITSGNQRFIEGGDRYQCAVLCARVVGAGGLGEAAPPESSAGSGDLQAGAPSPLFSALSAHAEQMADVAFAHSAMVLDNPGSRTLAIFGIPKSRGDESLRAFRAAGEMMERVQFMNELRLVEGKPSLQLAIGVAAGEVLLGQVGERLRAQFSAMGAPMDRATQLAVSASAGQVLVDEALAPALANKQMVPGPIPASLEAGGAA